MKGSTETLKKLSVIELCEGFEATNSISITQESAMVRGLIIDELESRDQEKFDKWMDADESEMDFPSMFFA